MVDAIDEHTALVAVSHVLFRSSFAIDPRPIVERAHAVGAPVILDCYQSAGIIPVDVTALGVDFATGGCLKWLCGGPGNAFLYARAPMCSRVCATRSRDGSRIPSRSPSTSTSSIRRLTRDGSRTARRRFLRTAALPGLKIGARSASIAFAPRRSR
mgnify:CR=1 FL=1